MFSFKDHIIRNRGYDRLVDIQYLLVFIFCGAVVGETLALSMVVTRIGPSIVGRLYLVNAIVLLPLPLLFSRYVDKIDRGKLLGWLLQGTFLLLTALLLFYELFNLNTTFGNGILVFLYPVAYLSKTILFLTFWTFLNDIYTIQESKKQFPVIAAWGFTGAITGVIIGRVLLTVVSTQTLMVLWIAVYVVAWVLVRRLSTRFKKRLRPAEDIPWMTRSLFGLGDLLKIRLVRIMSVFYFMTFLAVFSMDYLFWKRCFEMFETAERVASFQFSFYILHAFVTIILLRFALPTVIAKVGFTRVLFGLPVMLFAGGIALYVGSRQNGQRIEFGVFTVVQFLRYIFFEITFAPLYQLFFAAIVKERRGRAKTFLEGVVKPLAILSSGILLVAGFNRAGGLALLIAVSGLLLWIVVFYLRNVYRSTVLNVSRSTPGIEEVIEEAGQEEDERLYALVDRFAYSRETDLRMVAVHLLRRSGTRQAFEVMVGMYGREREQRIREMIARASSVFYNYQTRPFIERLLGEGDHRIRANAILAVNKMHCNWKKHLLPHIGPLLFESNLRVQLEAARYLWEVGTGAEKGTVMHLLTNLLASSDTGRKSAGVYLAGELQIDGWESIIIDNLHTASHQVYQRSIEVVFRNGSDAVRLQALKVIDILSRIHISESGKVIDRIGLEMKDTVVDMMPHLKTRRMKFEMIGCLVKMADTMRQAGLKLQIPSDTARMIERWMENELKIVYSDAFVFSMLKSQTWYMSNFTVLENALREKQLRLCEWVLAGIVLLDTRGIHHWRYAEMDIYDRGRREELIEVFESVGMEKTGMLVVALLKQEEWDLLAKIGRSSFNLDENETGDELAYFLKSENLLIALSGLYTLANNKIDYHNSKELSGVLKMLSYHKNELISSAANDLIEYQMDDQGRRGKAFELLESVLFFKSMRLFSGIGADKLLHLVEMARLVEYQKDAIVSMEGRVADQMYIVKTGVLRIETKNDGVDEIAAFIRAGETYGEVGLFSRSVRKVNALADETSSVYIMKGSDIKRLVREVPEVALNFLETISKRIVGDGVEFIMSKK